MRFAVQALAHALGGPEIGRRAEGAEALAEVQHPLVVLIEMRPAGQCSERDALVDVGIAGVVADLVRLDPAPGRGGDDLARLHHQVLEGELVLAPPVRQMSVVAAGLLVESEPALVGDLAVGLGGEHQDRVADMDIVAQRGHALGNTRLGDLAVLELEALVLFFRVPRQPLDVIAL